jgi:hypothetical protein
MNFIRSCIKKALNDPFRAIYKNQNKAAGQKQPDNPSFIQTFTVGAVVATAPSHPFERESRTLPPVGDFTLP